MRQVEYVGTLIKFDASGCFKVKASLLHRIFQICIQLTVASIMIYRQSFISVLFCIVPLHHRTKHIHDRIPINNTNPNMFSIYNNNELIRLQLFLE